MRIRTEILVTAVMFASLSQPLAGSRSPIIVLSGGSSLFDVRWQPFGRHRGICHHGRHTMRGWSQCKISLNSSAPVPVRMEGAQRAARLAWNGESIRSKHDDLCLWRVRTE